MCVQMKQATSTYTSNSPKQNYSTKVNTPVERERIFMDVLTQIRIGRALLYNLFLLSLGI